MRTLLVLSLLSLLAGAPSPGVASELEPPAAAAPVLAPAELAVLTTHLDDLHDDFSKRLSEKLEAKLEQKSRRALDRAFANLGRHDTPPPASPAAGVGPRTASTREGSESRMTCRELSADRLECTLRSK